MEDSEQFVMIPCTSAVYKEHMGLQLDLTALEGGIDGHLLRGVTLLPEHMYGAILSPPMPHFQVLYIVQ